MSQSQIQTIRPFEKAVFDALKFDADQVRKVDLSIGPRSQSVTIKFALSPDQIRQLDAMAEAESGASAPAAD